MPFDNSRFLPAQSEACKKALNTVMKAVFFENKPADRVLSSYFRNTKFLGARDRRLISDTVFHILRWWGFLRHLAADPVKQSEMEFYGIITGAFIIEDVNLPEIASFWAEKLGTTVSCLNEIKKLNNHKSRAERYFSLLKKIGHEPFTALPDELCLSELVPSWISEETGSGFDFELFIKWVQKRPPLWIRAQTNDIERLVSELKKNGIKALPHQKIRKALRIDDSRINLYLLEPFRKGIFEVQDLASQIIGLSCSPSPGERWWDACAGAGGKTLQLADIMCGKGSVTATDIRTYKLEDLRKRSRRAGFQNIRCSEWNGKALRSGKRETFDGVLVDAPCSCSGTWRRNPDAKWTVSQEEISEISGLQKKILQNAAGGVKNGGVLVYATCSVFKRENTDVVDNFLRNNANFAPEPFMNPLTSFKTNVLCVYPWDSDCDAVFIAKFRKMS